jgi:PRTRC genetic system protein B
MIAPYWNVDGDTAWTCQGSMRSPDDLGDDNIPLWEDAFYKSENTHNTGARRLTSHAGGFLALWRSLARGQRRFPTEFLMPAKEILQEFVTS